MSRAEQPPPPPPPVVTVSGGPEPVEPTAADAPSGPRSGAWIGLAALVLLAVVALMQQSSLPPAAAVQASLSVAGERIATSQAGVLVVPVRIDNRSEAAVTVDGLLLRAEPVRQDPATNGVRRVEAGSSGGFAAIVQPDCRVLSPASGIPFRATVSVALRTDAGVQRDLVLDLASEPAVVARIATLCGGARSAGVNWRP